MFHACSCHCLRFSDCEAVDCTRIFAECRVEEMRLLNAADGSLDALEFRISPSVAALVSEEGLGWDGVGWDWMGWGRGVHVIVKGVAS